MAQCCLKYRISACIRIALQHRTFNSGLFKFMTISPKQQNSPVKSTIERRTWCFEKIDNLGYIFGSLDFYSKKEGGQFSSISKNL